MARRWLVTAILGATFLTIVLGAMGVAGQESADLGLDLAKDRLNAHGNGFAADRPTGEQRRLATVTQAEAREYAEELTMDPRSVRAAELLVVVSVQDSDAVPCLCWVVSVDPEQAFMPGRRADGLGEWLLDWSLILIDAKTGNLVEWRTVGAPFFKNEDGTIVTAEEHGRDVEAAHRAIGGTVR